MACTRARNASGYDSSRRPEEECLVLLRFKYVEAYTPQMQDVFDAQAAGVLAQFAEGAVSDAKPTIVEHALKGTASRAIWQAIFANAIYTLMLIAVVIILDRAGVDLLSLAVSADG